MGELLRVCGATVMVDTPSGPVTLLDGIDVSLAEGEFLALVGKNGSGKSTLLQVIAGLCPLSAGELIWRDPASDPQRTSLVFQNPSLQMIGDTVLETVAFGLENGGMSEQDILERVRASLRAVGMEGLLQERTMTLSGGEQQLVGVAAALATDAQLLLFDEAAAMLDHVSRSRLMDAVRSLRERGCTVIWATHDMDEVALADRVIALERGRMVFEGTPRSFFYGGCDGGSSGSSSSTVPCVELGFSPPLVVSVAREMVKAGANVREWPLTEQQFWRMVEHLWR
jgi:energy-coupling factor transporter ATP-binding protein EcfA2